MAEPDAALKQDIVEFLNSRKLDAIEIPSTSNMTPDLLVDAGTTGACLIEIKEKSDNPEEMIDLAADLKSGGVVEHCKPTSYWSRLDAIIRHGCDQLDTHDPDHTLNHVIWFHCNGLDAVSARERLVATLYGSRKLFSSAIENIVTAYYFSNGAFYRYRMSLDAVVVSIGVTAGIFINSFSVRSPTMQSSPFCQIFEHPFLPESFVKRPDVMICDGPAPRENQDAMLSFLRNKYALDHLQIMDMDVVMGIVETLPAHRMGRSMPPPHVDPEPRG